MPTEPREIPDQLTPVPEDEFILTTARAWKRFYGAGPKLAPLACCLSQMVLEVGRAPDPKVKGKYLWGKYSHNRNVGNLKSREGDGSSWQFYPCGEEVSLAQAQKLQAAHPKLITIKKIYNWPNGAKRASIWILPKHEWARFRAYDSLEEGLLDYIDFLVMERDRYLDAWNKGVLQGDPVQFSLLLGKAGYYTADPGAYTKTVVSLFNEFAPKVRAVLESAEGQAIYADEKKRAMDQVLQIVALNTSQAIQDAFGVDPDSIQPLDEDEARLAQAANVPGGREAA